MFFNAQVENRDYTYQNKKHACLQSCDTLRKNRFSTMEKNEQKPNI